MRQYREIQFSAEILGFRVTVGVLPNSADFTRYALRDRGLCPLRPTILPRGSLHLSRSIHTFARQTAGVVELCHF